VRPGGKSVRPWARVLVEPCHAALGVQEVSPRRPPVKVPGMYLAELRERAVEEGAAPAIDRSHKSARYGPGTLLGGIVSWPQRRSYRSTPSTHGCAFGTSSSLATLGAGVTSSLQPSAEFDNEESGLSTSLQCPLHLVAQSVFVAGDDAAVGDRGRLHCLLHETVEEQPAGPGGAPVEAERVLVQVVVEVLAGHRSLMGTE
jgi:hypothetical protein